MIHFALAGFSQGYYATTYLRYLSRLREVEIAAVCDCGETEEYVRECAFTTAGEFARELGVPLLHDYGKLLDRAPDAVLVCGETVDHAAMAARALERGIHTFVSKPLCFTVEQAALLRGKKKPGVCLLCGNPLKYEQGLMELRERLSQGEIGRVYSFRLRLNHLAMTEQAWERDPSRSGGPLGTYGVYLFDLARWLTGEELVTLYALGDNCATPQIGDADTVKVLAKGRSGAQFSLELFSAIRHEYPFVQIEAVGERGTIETRFDNYALLARIGRSARLGALRTSDMGAGEMEHFLDCIRSSVPERCSLEDMEYVARCIEAARESLRAGIPAAVKGRGEEDG